MITKLDYLSKICFSNIRKYSRIERDVEYYSSPAKIPLYEISNRIKRLIIRSRYIKHSKLPIPTEEFSIIKRITRDNKYLPFKETFELHIAPLQSLYERQNRHE